MPKNYLPTLRTGGRSQRKDEKSFKKEIEFSNSNDVLVKKVKPRPRQIVPIVQGKIFIVELATGQLF